MQRETFLFVVGILVFVTPFLGIPESWKATLLFTIGAGTVLYAVLARLNLRREERNDKDVFYAENEPTTHTIGRPIV